VYLRTVPLVAECLDEGTLCDVIVPVYVQFNILMNTLINVHKNVHMWMMCPSELNCTYKHTCARYQVAELAEGVPLEGVLYPRRACLQVPQRALRPLVVP